MRKFLICVVTLLFIVCTTSIVFASDNLSGSNDDGFKFGLKFSFPAISKSDDINGGSYLNLSSVLSFNQNASFSIGYMTDLAPYLCSDKLISATQQFIIKKNNMGTSNSQMSLGITYLKSSKDDYYGLKFTPFLSDRAESYKDISISLFTIGYLYSPKTSNHIFTLEVLSFGGYF
jgi:hypothetical protein